MKKKNKKRKLSSRQIQNIVADSVYDLGVRLQKKIGSEDQFYVEYVLFCLLTGLIGEHTPKNVLKKYFKEAIDKVYVK